MKKSLFLFFFITVTSVIPMTAWSVKIAGITIQDTLSLDGTVLNSNGAGKRVMADIGVYVLQLFVTNKSKDAQTIVESDESMAFLCNITEIKEGSTMRDLLRGGQQEEELSEKVKEMLDNICKAFPGPVNEDDTFLISYTPGKGTEISKNSEPGMTIPELSNKIGIFGTWLSKEIIGHELQGDLLSNPPRSE